MPVTELALCRLKHHHGTDQRLRASEPSPPLPQNHAIDTSATTSSSTIPDPVFADLKAAAHAQASFSGFPVVILQCIEDPLLIYLVGGWNSTSQHVDEWIPSRQNQDLMAKLTRNVDVLWMFHVDLHPDAVRGILLSNEDDTASEKRDVVAIGRHFVRRDARDAFSKTWVDNADALEAFLGDGDRAVGVLRMRRGWAVDYGVMLARDPGREEACKVVGEGGEGQIDEMVVFTAWPSVDRHLQFAKTGDFQRYSQIRRVMVGAEIKHVKVVFEERKGID